jgi:conjugal transfer mating pair stabilization protein TraG
MYNIYSIGGGEIIYEVLKAVALCLNGGDGVLRALLTIGGLSGAFMIYFLFLYGNIEKIMKTWALPMTALLHLFFVPEVTVWVHDDVSVFHKKLDHVPYGLGVFAASISQIGKAITEVVEQNFSTPDDLKYHKTGMMFGSDILEKARQFKIVNRNFHENMRNFVGQCVKYDIMLNHKYTFDNLRNSSDVWTLVTSNPSVNRGIFWLPPEGGRAKYLTCAQVVAQFNRVWQQELTRVSLDLGGKLFSGRAIGHSSLSGAPFKMSPQLAQLLKAEFLGNLQSVYGYLGNLAQSSEEILKQNIMINAVQDSASENSHASGNPISFSEMKALLQQNYTFETVGRLAAKVLPIMKAVLEALVYACFIFIIPLCMIPSGYKFLFNWVAVLVWLQAWAPMYAILNFIMNIAARASTIAEMGTVGGVSIANIAGVSAANAEIKVLAGYLTISIPFICIAIVKGLGTFVHLAGQMTGTSTQSAASSATEIAGGNFSYGNVSFDNSQTRNVSQLQRNFGSSLGVGGHILDTGGEQTRNDISGRSVITRAVSSGPTDISSSHSNVEEMRKSWQDSVQQAQNEMESLQKSQSLASSQTQRMANILSSGMSVADLQKYGFGKDEATQIMNAAKVVASQHSGHEYGQASQAGGSLGLNISGSKDIISGGLGISGNVTASNSHNLGESSQASTSEDVNSSQRIVENAMKDISVSERNDELTQLARDHVQTLSEVEQHSRNKSYHEQQAKNYQESLSKGENLNFSSRNNLMDHALKIAQEEEGLSLKESSELLHSQKTEDQSARNEIFRKTHDESGRFMRNDSFMKQPNFARFNHKNSLENEFKRSTSSDSNFDQKMLQMQSDLERKKQNIDAKIDDFIAQSDIEKMKQSIENKSQKIQQKVDKRADMGVAKAAWNKLMEKE